MFWLVTGGVRTFSSQYFKSLFLTSPLDVVEFYGLVTLIVNIFKGYKRLWWICQGNMLFVSSKTIP
jgi:hypothetical protein